MSFFYSFVLTQELQSNSNSISCCIIPLHSHLGTDHVQSHLLKSNEEAHKAQWKHSSCLQMELGQFVSPPL